MGEKWDRFLCWADSRRLGVRSVDLVLLSIIWVIVGWAAVARDPDPNVRIPIEYLPETFRSGIWYVSAAVATWVAITRNHGKDNLGFAFLVLPPALRAVSYWVVWVQGLLGIGEGVRLWPDAVVWTTVAIIVYRLARRPELPQRPDGGEYGRRPLRRRRESP